MTNNDAPPGQRLRTHDPTESERETSSDSTTATGPHRPAQTAESGDESLDSETDVCPECDGKVISDDTHGEMVCRDCGLVISEDEIDHGPEWRAFNATERDQKSRVGGPVTKARHDKGLTSTISPQNKDAYGNPLNQRQQQRVRRLRKWDKRTNAASATELNLRQAFGELKRMRSALGMPKNVEETAAAIYRRAHSEGLVQGRSIEAVSSAALYIAARMEGYPRSFNEVQRVSRLTTDSRGDSTDINNRIASAHRHLCRDLDIELKPADPVDYLDRICSSIPASAISNRDAVSEEVKRLAHDFTEFMKETELHVGRSPPGITAAAIYAAGIACNQRINQDALRDAANVQNATIRDNYQRLQEGLDPEWFFAKPYRA